VYSSKFFFFIFGTVAFSEGDVLYIEMDERAILKIRDAGVKLSPIEEDIITEMQSQEERPTLLGKVILYPPCFGVDGD
jgi:hypothetical protein